MRCYRIIDFEFPNQSQIPPKLYTPRPEQCLQFFPSPTKIQYQTKAASIIPKHGLLFGQHTITNLRTVYARFLSIQVVFQAGALYRLTGLPASLTVNEAIDAELIFGKAIEMINDQLFHAKTHQQMIDIVAAFIESKAKQALQANRPIDQMAQLMTQSSLTYTLDQFIAGSCLSHRQFNRNFLDRVGISPKAFLRIKRFDEAYRMKNNSPTTPWFKIAIDCGYEDYQHLSKDYKDFTGLSPAAFFALDSPERVFGFEEAY